jgi:hypothetical protein
MTIRITQLEGEAQTGKTFLVEVSLDVGRAQRTERIYDDILDRRDGQQ